MAKVKPEDLPLPDKDSLESLTELVSVPEAAENGLLEPIADGDEQGGGNGLRGEQRQLGQDHNNGVQEGGDGDIMCVFEGQCKARGAT